MPDMVTAVQADCSIRLDGIFWMHNNMPPLLCGSFD